MQSYQIQNTAKNNVQGNKNAKIIRLNPSDFAIASDHLSAAFSQDPLINYFLPEDSVAKQRSLKHLSGAFLNFAQPYGHIYTTADEPKGVAIWLPPEAFQTALSQLQQAIASGLIVSPFFMRWSRIMDLISLVATEFQLHDKLAPEPHWYLGMLGVSPSYQGQGIGGMLLQPVLEQADRTKMPCYLETTTTAAVRFYQRRGFEVVHQERFAGREYWAMKRYPQR
ncbi:MAG: GNAT family N-acetyltransferase [Cyanothece sp. SIO2G6]|nr:GNAT family N-acetyltransferase [Cyanothece sp. SIO2G6]